jgi:hypothetical protein
MVLVVIGGLSEQSTGRVLMPERGYQYKSQDGKQMVEFHIDDIPENPLLTKITYMCQFGGNLSVRKQEDERPMSSVTMSAFSISIFLLVKHERG